MSKDEQIKLLHDKIGNKKENNGNDATRYKNLYDEHRQRSNLEHELLSNSLYDLTLQFISFKNELVKSSNKETDDF
jgi:hypothetical protein